MSTPRTKAFLQQDDIGREDLVDFAMQLELELIEIRESLKKAKDLLEQSEKPFYEGCCKIRAILEK